MALEEDSNLCRETFAELLARALADETRLSEPERTVLLVGRFLHVLVDLQRTARALRRIDADQIAAEFEANRDGKDSAIRVITELLAQYIRDHLQSLDLAEPPIAEIVAQAAAVEPEKPRTLPHWAGVAFAARCAQLVFSLLSQYWPKIPMERAARIRYAIDEAAASAAQGESRADLNFIVVEMMAMAGAALVGASGIGPPDARAAQFASFIAKVAEKAADAARTSASKSAQQVREAFDFALQAAAELPQLTRQFKRERKRLLRAAAQGNWAEDRRLSQEELDAIVSASSSRKSWWKMW